MREIGGGASGVLWFVCVALPVCPPLFYFCCVIGPFVEGSLSRKMLFGGDSFAGLMQECGLTEGCYTVKSWQRGGAGLISFSELRSKVC